MTMKKIPSFSDCSDSTAELSTDLNGDESSRRVQFGAIHVREYERIVGDHPDTRYGVPLSIGWAYNEKKPMPLNKYEESKVSKGTLRMSSITRKNILHNQFGIPEEELRAAEKEVQRIKKARQLSNKQSKIAAQAESALKVWKRKISQSFSSENVMKSVAAATSLMIPISIP